MTEHAPLRIAVTLPGSSPMSRAEPHPITKKYLSMVSSHILNLANLFRDQPTRLVKYGTKMYRGCWLPQGIFPGGNWFSTTLSGASGYVAMGANNGRNNNLTPYIFEGATNQNIELIEFDENHIDAFSTVYNGDWKHEQIVQDTPLALALIGHPNCAGFFRPSAEEYFLCNPASILTQGNTLTGQRALTEASRVKGFTI